MMGVCGRILVSDEDKMKSMNAVGDIPLRFDDEIAS